MTTLQVFVRCFIGPTVLLLLLLAPPIFACTTVGVTKEASANGKVFASQSNDGSGQSDTRMFHVPAADHPPGAKRPVFFYQGHYPRYVGNARGAHNYVPKAGQNVSVPIGYVPQVAHTHAFYDGGFGLLNDQGVGIAESTCTSRMKGSRARNHGGAALWYTDELSRMAMERTSTAREAVLLMGELSVTGGFYGEGNMEGTGESLIVADRTEVWVFHVLSSDPNGTSAVWVAQRVPEGHVAVVPNIYIVREIDLSDDANYLASSNIYSVAISNGWWNPEDNIPFDFTKVYSGGEYNHRYYSGRRWWGAMRILVPSAHFPSSYVDLRDSAPYPFSVPIVSTSSSVESSSSSSPPITLEKVMEVMRDMYQNTTFDMTQGMAAGPFGNGNRYDGILDRPGQPGINGSWERSIAIYRSAYTYVVEIDAVDGDTAGDTAGGDALPSSVGAVLWFGSVAAHTTAYVPLFAGQDSLLPAYSVGHKGGPLDRASAMWAFRYVQQIVNIRFDLMMKEVQDLQRALHGSARQMQDAAVAAWQEKGKPTYHNATALSSATNTHAALVLRSWWLLADHLIWKFAEGNIYTVPSEIGPGTPKPAGYPVWWLRAVGYQNGPPPPPL